MQKKQRGPAEEAAAPPGKAGKKVRISEADRSHAEHRKRLRRRFRREGLDEFTDVQAVELLLFQSIPRIDVNPLAHTLLRHFGSFGNLLRASAEELMQVEGIGENTATNLTLLLPVLRRYLQDGQRPGKQMQTQSACGQYLQAKCLGEREEVGYLLCLNAKGQLIDCKLMQRGTRTGTYVDLRELAGTAFRLNAASVVLGHNHPGGELYPSEADIASTTALKEALALFDIRLLDHFIVSDDGYLSLAGCDTLHGVLCPVDRKGRYLLR